MNTVENIHKRIIEAKPFILCNLHKARSGAQAHKKRHSGRTTFEVPKRKIRTVFVVGVLPKKIRHATPASRAASIQAEVVLQYYYYVSLLKCFHNELYNKE